MTVAPIPLSVLELAPVASGVSPAQTIRSVLEIAEAAEELGYLRYWIAEHHNSPKCATSAPAVLVAHVSAHTRRLRVGSGAVLLGIHPPLVVAEQFAVLEALHPGRIDLGVARSTGLVEPHAEAERGLNFSARGWYEFPESVDALRGFLGHTSSATMTPQVTPPPPIHILGTTENSARVAAERGLPFVYGHHQGAGKARPAGVERYRNEFDGSAGASPHLIVSVSVLCADTDDEAHAKAMTQALRDVVADAGDPGPDEPSAARRRFLAQRRLDDAGLLVGGPARVVSQLHATAAAFRADELILVPYEHAAADRIRTLRLVAGAWAGDPARD